MQDLPLRAEIAGMIDHSLLRPELTTDDIRTGCVEARALGTVSVCLRPCDLSIGREALQGSPVRIGTVVSFPLGYCQTAVKVLETEKAIEAGAQEVDMVLNIGRLLAGDVKCVESDVAAVVDTAHAHGALVKVIFENCYLSDALKIEACKICNRTGADWAKTSTGFGTGGATLDDVRLMRAHCDPKVQIKAAGGVRTLESLLQYRELGCTRIGATATASILAEVEWGKS